MQWTVLIKYQKANWSSLDECDFQYFQNICQLWSYIPPMNIQAIRCVHNSGIGCDSEFSIFPNSYALENWNRICCQGIKFMKYVLAHL